jgi:hypothetical protein
MAIVGLISLVFLVAFTMLYLSKSMASKPKFMEDAVAKISANIETISFWGVIYGLAAGVLSMIMARYRMELFVGFAAHVLLIVMALPYSFDRLSAKCAGKVNEAIMTETKSLVGWFVRQEKYIGYAAAVVTLLYFAVLFR